MRWRTLLHALSVVLMPTTASAQGPIVAPSPPGQQTAGRFTTSVDQSCATVGGAPITSESECKLAQKTLGLQLLLADDQVNKLELDPWKPMGCTYETWYGAGDTDATARLYLNSPDEDGGVSAAACSPARKCLCSSLFPCTTSYDPLFSINPLEFEELDQDVGNCTLEEVGSDCRKSAGQLVEEPGKIYCITLFAQIGVTYASWQEICDSDLEGFPYFTKSALYPYHPLCNASCTSQARREMKLTQKVRDICGFECAEALAALKQDVDFCALAPPPVPPPTRPPPIAPVPSNPPAPPPPCGLFDCQDLGGIIGIGSGFLAAALVLGYVVVRCGKRYNVKEKLQTKMHDASVKWLTKLPSARRGLGGSGRLPGLSRSRSEKAKAARDNFQTKGGRVGKKETGTEREPSTKWLGRSTNPSGVPKSEQQGGKVLRDPAGSKKKSSMKKGPTAPPPPTVASPRAGLIWPEQPRAAGLQGGRAGGTELFAEETASPRLPANLRDERPKYNPADYDHPPQVGAAATAGSRFM